MPLSRKETYDRFQGIHEPGHINQVTGRKGHDRLWHVVALPNQGSPKSGRLHPRQPGLGTNSPPRILARHNIASVAVSSHVEGAPASKRRTRRSVAAYTHRAFTEPSETATFGPCKVTFFRSTTYSSRSTTGVTMLVNFTLPTPSGRLRPVAPSQPRKKPVICQSASSMKQPGMTGSRVK
jgi:hypothetical protein